VCGRTAGKLLLRQQFAAMSAGSLLAGYDVVVCRGCGAGYADAIPPQTAFDDHYREMSKYEYQLRGGRESEYDLARFRAVAAIIDQLAPSRGIRILDVGCATGGLLALLKERGYGHVWGLDPSPMCAAAARRLYGIEVITGSLAELQRGGAAVRGWGATAGLSSSARSTGGQATRGTHQEEICSRLSRHEFELVILSGVLEHIREVRWALGVLANVLAESGLMFVSVPDATRFAAEEDAPLQQFSTEHINFFSPVSLDNAMQAAGFVPRLSRQNAYPQEHGTVMPVVDAMFQLQGPLSLRERARVRAGGRQTPLCRSGKHPMPSPPAPLPKGEGRRFDRATEPALAEYIRRSREVDKRIRAAIGAIVARGQPIVVWGVGTHTLRLLATSRLAEAQIVAFVDSNPRYQGKQLHGRPIIAPDELRGRSEPILISSRVFQRDIERQIRESLGLANQLHFLYSLPAGTGSFFDRGLSQVSSDETGTVPFGRAEKCACPLIAPDKEPR
jgi:SAM-dependent methyltransferase